MTQTARTLCLAVSIVLAVSAAASARPLTQQERSYLRNLEGMLRLDVERAEGLSSKRTGASGVRARFQGGLTVIRLSFRSPSEAKAYAAKRAGSQSETKQIQARGAEVVLVGGPGAKTHLSAVWNASLEAPSVASRPAPRTIKRPGRAPLRLRPLGKLARPRAKAPTSKTLGGSYLLVGSERVVIDQVEGGPDGIRCRVRLEGFTRGEGQQLVFDAIFDGQALLLKVDPTLAVDGEPREICFVWKPSARGAVTFIRTGGPTKLLPEAVSRFWHPDAE